MPSTLGPVSVKEMSVKPFEATGLPKTPKRDSRANTYNGLAAAKRRSARLRTPERGPRKVSCSSQAASAPGSPNMASPFQEPIGQLDQSEAPECVSTQVELRGSEHMKAAVRTTETRNVSGGSKTTSRNVSGGTKTSTAHSQATNKESATARTDDTVATTVDLDARSTPDEKDVVSANANAEASQESDDLVWAHSAPDPPINLKEAGKALHFAAYEQADNSNSDDTAAEQDVSPDVPSDQDDGEHWDDTVGDIPQVYVKSCCCIECTCPNRFGLHSGFSRQSPLVIVHEYSDKDLTTSTVSQIIVRDDNVKNVLEEIFKGHPDFCRRTLGDGDWVFKSPFTLFFHRWDRIISYRVVQHMKPLQWQQVQDSLLAAFDPLLNTLQTIRETGEIEFNHLWLIYAPETLLVSETLVPGAKNSRVTSAAQVVHCQPRHGDNRNNDHNNNNKSEIAWWEVESRSLQSDGVNVGWSTEKWCVPRYEGYRRVDALFPYFPIDFHHDRFTLMKDLYARGKAATKYMTGVHRLQFSGKIRDPRKDEHGKWQQGPSVPHMVIIDVNGYFNHCNGATRPLIRDQMTPEELAGARSQLEWNDVASGEVPEVFRGGRHIEYEYFSCGHTEQENCGMVDFGWLKKAGAQDNIKAGGHGGQQVIGHRRVPSDKSQHPPSERRAQVKNGDQQNDNTGHVKPVPRPATLNVWKTPDEQNTGTDDFGYLLRTETLLAHGYLGGFDVEAKKWFQFPANGLEKPDWDVHSLDSLYYASSEEKRTAERMYQLVCKKLDEGAMWSDIVLPCTGILSYLGRPLIFLLSGPHGVGKTATIRAIAMMCQTTVYSTTAEQLCNSAGGFFTGLQKALNICQTTGYLFLLEDADTLTRGDAKCKDHVAMIQQCLAQYQGIMFMTTTNGKHIPHGLPSRVDQHLPLKPLDKEARRRVWTNEIKKQGLLEKLNSLKLRYLLRGLTDLDLNGHEISNIVKQAPMLCMGGKNVPDIDHYASIMGDLAQDRQFLDTSHAGNSRLFPWASERDVQVALEFLARQAKLAEKAGRFDSDN